MTAATYRGLANEMEEERAAIHRWLDGAGRGFCEADRAWAQNLADSLTRKIARASEMANARH